MIEIIVAKKGLLNDEQYLEVIVSSLLKVDLDSAKELLSAKTKLSMPCDRFVEIARPIAGEWWEFVMDQYNTHIIRSYGSLMDDLLNKLGYPFIPDGSHSGRVCDECSRWFYDEDDTTPVKDDGNLFSDGFYSGDVYCICDECYKELKNE